MLIYVCVDVGIRYRYIEIETYIHTYIHVGLDNWDAREDHERAQCQGVQLYYLQPCVDTCIDIETDRFIYRYIYIYIYIYMYIFIDTYSDLLAVFSWHIGGETGVVAVFIHVLTYYIYIYILYYIMYKYVCSNAMICADGI
jgi:hypothetical protein